MLSPVQLQNIPRVGRKNRNPQHPFHIAHRAWQIQPFMIAPVLPGDTLQNILLQSRAVSAPVKSALIGWWLEHYFFYVPHRALAGSADFQAMMLSTTATAGNLNVSVDATHYKYANSVNWTGQCLDAVVQEFFRDEGESLTAGQINSRYSAQINRQDWMESSMTATVFDASQPGSVPVVDSTDANSTLDAHEVDAAMRQWSMLRDMRLTDMTYEDYLRTYGVKVPDREYTILPELIRYTRDWTYPANTVDPSTGTPSSALSWSIAERADKKRLFKEPGFIFGVTVARPKVYINGQTGSAVGLLDNAFAWLPALLGDDPYSSLKRVTNATGPLPGLTDTYIVDLKDLYLYGDQFYTLGLTTTATPDGNLVSVPTSAHVKKYASDTDADALFVNPTVATDTVRTGLGRHVRQDGTVSLTIASRVIDTTSKT